MGASLPGHYSKNLHRDNIENRDSHSLKQTVADRPLTASGQKRECDLIAALWAAHAVPTQELVDRRCVGMHAFVLGWDPEPAAKPHGRFA
jgi:hypothetical protein